MQRYPMADVLGGLAYALDLTGGQSAGHALRSNLIAMRLSDELGLSGTDRSALFYASLVKDAGCSANAAETAALFRTDDHQLKNSRRRIVDGDAREERRWALASAGRGEGFGARFRATVELLTTPTAGMRLARVRCERGAEIARTIGLDEASCEAVLHLYEHWDGAGRPAGLAADDISLLARILSVAQTIEVHLDATSYDDAMELIDDHAGRWFDPTVVRAVHAISPRDRLWSHLRTEQLGVAVARHDPGDRTVSADGSSLDSIARAFAEVIDAKSPYTFEHSLRVAEIATVLGRRLDFDEAGLVALRRAGLLHDIGKLGVSSRILDKRGPLSAAEAVAVRRHTGATMAILERTACLADLATLAGNHHERLDGSGYGRGLRADQLDLPMRVLAVADVYEALTAPRPYRNEMSRSDALACVTDDAPKRLDGDVVAALRSAVSDGAFSDADVQRQPIS